MQLPNKSFLTVVAGSARVLAQWGAAAGFFVHVIDRFGDWDTRQCGTWEMAPETWDELPSFMATQRSDGLIYAGGLEAYPDVLQKLAERFPVLGVSHLPSQRLVRDLTHLANSAQKHGFCIPKHQTHANPHLRHWLWKARDSSGGGGVFSASHLQNETARSRNASGLWLERIRGRPIGVSFLGGGRIQGTKFLGACWMLKPPGRGPDPFGYRGSFGPANLSPTDQSRLNAFGNSLSERYDLRGWFGIDFIVDAQGEWWLLEVNPRWCASMEILAGDKGGHWLKSHMDACQGKPIADGSDKSHNEAVKPEANICLKRIVRYRQSLHVPAGLDWPTIMHKLKPHRLCDVPLPGTDVPANQPFCTFMVQAADAREAILASRQLKIQLERELWSLR